ncbi:uncharacterized protein [Palaemon carinicauda]|uniref:uncharacterized protein n=1 Tax=Palaemon carinicauda TaxID=392227 RepID=UPI0035B68F25
MCAVFGRHWCLSYSRPPDVCLIAANRSNIPTHGYKTLTLLFGRAKYHWKLLIHNVTLPLIRVDFLTHFHLLVDVAHRPLVNAGSYASTPQKYSPSDLALHISAPSEAYAHLLTLYPEVFRPELCQTHTVPSKHGIYHHTKMRVFARFRNLAPDHLAAAEQTLAEMEEIGLYQKASSLWSSPFPIILKKDGSLCHCEDYRCLKMGTETNHYQLPNIKNIYLHKEKVFSTLYLLKEYYQVPMKPEDINKTAITSPYSKYTFNYSCFAFVMLGTFFNTLWIESQGTSRSAYVTWTTYLCSLLPKRNTSITYASYSTAYNRMALKSDMISVHLAPTKYHS